MADGKVVIETDLDSSGIEKGLKSLGSITAKGLKVATTTIAGTATALAGVSTAAIKVGSDFEAQMSRVKAISGATGEEFDQLRKQAIDLGADTAFSASQAAQGMENLAAAGFETDEIMSAMPGMLDLAAASGEDLAASADIAASTLRGFGLEASEAGHVADVLAENANRTNSSVAETGEAMKYIAPLARAAGISMEETAAAIGIMANAGIQGSQAGTTLRGALSRLSKPTDIMQQAMDELGVSFYDSEGKMLSLAEQVGMLQSAMEGMTDEQKNNYLVTLYGQEALSGMLTLINEGPDSLSSLTAAYEACDGSAKAAAETMQDNLKGAVEQLSGSAETLGIVFYDSVAENLKNAAQVATDSVNNITDAFNNGGLDAAISAAGDEFANLATEAASHAPEMADVAVEFIQSFAGGVVNNRGRLIDAAGEAAHALASGLAELLPSELQAPVNDAIEAISDSLSSGGLKKAGKVAVDTFENLIDVAGVLSGTALPLLTSAIDLVSGNFGTVVPLAASAAAAFKTYNTVTKTTGTITKTLAAVTKTLTAMEKANALQLVATNGGLTLRQTLIALYNGQITVSTALTGLWTKAQTALNVAMAANPIGLMVTAIAALLAGMTALYLLSDKQTKVTAKLSDEQKKLCDGINETSDELSSLQTSMQESVQSSMQEIDATGALWSELQTLVDANGRVKEGYEARAKYITGELSSALGVEMELIDGVIQGYAEQKDAIEDLIETKRAQAALDGMEQSYQEAVQKSTDALNEYLSAQKASEAAAINLSAAKQKLSSLEKKAAEEAKLYGNTTAQTNDAVLAAQQEVDQLSANYDKLSQSTADARANYEGYQTVIQQYEGLSAAIISGDATAIKEALLSVQADFVRYGEVTDEELKKSVTSAAGNMALLGQEIKNGIVSATDSAVADFANMTAMSLAELSKLPGGAAAQFSSIEPEAVAALIGLSGSLSTESREAVSSFLEGFDGLDSETKGIWAEAVYGALEGLEGFEDLADPAVEGADVFLESLRAALEVHSPSQAVKSIFSQVWPGAVEGLTEGQENLNTTGMSVIQNFLVTLSSGDLLEGAKQIGANLMTFFGIGVGSQSDNSKAQGKANADAANQGAGSVDATPTGNKFGTLFGNGISAMSSFLSGKGKGVGNSAKSGAGSIDPTGTGRTFGTKFGNAIGGTSGTLRNKGKSIADSANKGAGSVNPSGSGKTFGSKYASGISSKNSSSKQTGKNLAKNADSGLRSVSASSAGYNFGSGFGGGIRNAISNAVSAAASLARSALSKIKSVLGINSPSKETQEVGAFFGEGLEIGISGEEKRVEKASRNLAAAALSPLDMSAISDRMREAMTYNTGRIAKAIAVETSNTIISRQQAENLVKISDEDVDYNRFALAVAEAMKNVRVEMDGEKVADLTTPRVSHNEYISVRRRR